MALTTILIWDNPGIEPQEKEFPFGKGSESSRHNWVAWATYQDITALKNGTVHTISDGETPLKGDIVLKAGPNIEIQTLPGENSIQITSTGGSGAGPHIHTTGWDLKNEVQDEKRGCTLFEGYLYVTGYDSQTSTNRIFKVDLTDLSTITSWESQSTFPWGLTHDTTYLYETDNDTKNRLIRYDPSTQEYTEIYLGESTEGDLMGIEWDPGLQKFWLTDNKNKIYSTDLQTLGPSEILPEAGSPMPSAICYDSNTSWLWISFVYNYNTHKILAINQDLLPQAVLPNFGEWLGLTYDPSECRFYGSCKAQSAAQSMYWLFKTKPINGVL